METVKPPAAARAADLPVRAASAPLTEAAAADKALWLEAKLTQAVADHAARHGAARAEHVALRGLLVAMPVVSALLLGLSLPGYDALFRYVAFGLNLLLVPLMASFVLSTGQEAAAERRAVQAELAALLDELEYTTKWPGGGVPDPRKVDALYARYQALAVRMR